MPAIQPTLFDSGGAAPPAIAPRLSGNILDNAVLLTLELHRLGVKRKISPEAVNRGMGVHTDADPDMIHVSKDILESKALEHVRKIDGAIRSYVKDHGLPSPFKADFLSIDLVIQVDERLKEFQAERAAAVAEFMDEYETVSAAAESRLGSLYDPADYPPVEKVRSLFFMVWRFMEFGVPGRLRSINPALFEAESAKMQATIQNATEQVVLALRSQMADLTDHLLDRLKPTEDGKRKKFHESNVENIRAFLETFNARNITNDQELAALVTKCEQLLDGVKVEDLKDQGKVREQVTAGFRDIKTELDKMLVNAPRRRFSADED